MVLDSGGIMTDTKEVIDELFEAFLEELCNHIRIVGGVGNPESFRRMPLEELYKHLWPNNIIIGFRNVRMINKYQLSRQMKMEVLYED